MARSGRPLRTRRAGGGLLCAALLLLLALPGPSAEAGDGWWGGLDEGEAVSLADVLRGPEAYRSKPLTFFCLFHRKESYFDPVRTPFTQARYDNFSVWPDGAAVWQEKAYVNDMPFLYIPRNHEQRDALMATPLFTRLEVTGRIREMLRGRPAIEVFSYRVTGHRVGKKVIDDINRGNIHARRGTENGYQMAARNYRAALTPDLPPLYAISVRKMLAQALRKLGHEEEAGAYERGETYGTPDMPEPDPRAREPRNDLPPPPGLGGDLPGTPASELPGPPTTDLPGAPPTGAEMPMAPSGFGPRPRSLSGDDLPGAPRAPVTRDDDLPGTRGASAPRSLDPEIDLPAPGDGPAVTSFPPPRLRPGLSEPARPGAPAQPSDPTLRPTPSPPLEIEPAKEFRPAVPVANSNTPPPPVRKGPVSGIPPKRVPRISGVR